jgi:hypothetical protein
MTASYRLLEDHYINNVLLSAGVTVTAGIDVPSNWSPTLNVDPLTTDAVNAFYANRPGLPGLCRAQFSTQAVPPPATYWTAKPGPVTEWQLTGLGAALAPVFY